MTQVLYHEPSLRPAILRGLKAVVEGNISASSIPDTRAPGGDDPLVDDEELDVTGRMPFITSKSTPSSKSLLTVEEAKENVAYLNSQAKSWLAVLFNVFTSMEKESRAMVGSVISVWAGISSEPVRCILSVSSI